MLCASRTVSFVLFWSAVGMILQSGSCHVKVLDEREYDKNVAPIDKNVLRMLHSNLQSLATLFRLRAKDTLVRLHMIQKSTENSQHSSTLAVATIATTTSEPTLEYYGALSPKFQNK